MSAALLLLQLAACDIYDSALLNAVTTFGASSELCGNGRVDDGERCDTAISDSEAGACPSECGAADACAPKVLVGTECQVSCLTIRITKPKDGDGCCPSFVGAAEDTDCGFCGDGIIGPAESCDPPETCATREQCTRNDQCLVSVFSGDPAECTARCELTVLHACADGDGCCPADCDAMTDNDCSLSCGDGVLQREIGETCERDGTGPACLKSCNDAQACTEDLMVGTARNCNVACVNAAITQPVDEDGCCPPGAHALNDSDCAATCGNRVREADETCDPCPAGCDDGDPCTVDAASGTAAACSLNCTHTPITAAAAGDACCPSGANASTDPDCKATCGNGVTESGEECDGGTLCDAQCHRTQEARCIAADTTSANDACRRCRCSQCGDLMLGCLSNPDESFASHCRDVIECAHERHCTGSACYCGLSAFCARPSGVCRAPIDAAALAARRTVEACTDAPDCALHQTTAIGECVEARCATECGQ